jgi:hypothetical protein
MTILLSCSNKNVKPNNIIFEDNDTNGNDINSALNGIGFSLEIAREECHARMNGNRYLGETGNWVSDNYINEIKGGEKNALYIFPGHGGNGYNGSWIVSEKQYVEYYPEHFP